MSERFYCVDCKRFIDPTTSLRCPLCGSDALVSEHALQNALRASLSPIRVANSSQATLSDEERAKREYRSPESCAKRDAQDAERIRDFLRRHGHGDIATQWDGWLWELVHPDTNSLARRMAETKVFGTSFSAQLVLTNHDDNFTEWTFDLTLNSVALKLRKEEQTHATLAEEAGPPTQD